MSLNTRYKDTALLELDVYLVGHHGAANATTDALLRAVTLKIAVISMGAPDRMTDWMAWAYGHPPKLIVQQLVGKVSGTRPARSVPVTTGVRTFERISISKAIFATGWDGTIVLEAGTAGAWNLVSDQSHTPLVATPRKVNLNTASADELDTLPMIGLTRARQIVAFRQANGPFGAVGDLMNIPGIGNGTMKAIRHPLPVTDSP